MGRAPLNLNRFDLASLRLYAATVDGGSLTAGAERFGISLAAARTRIAELEAHVGRPLLERSKRGVAPTPAGQTLYRHAIEVVTRVEQLAVAMGDFDRGVQGHLRLWANASAFGGFLPELLAEYTKQYPDVRIDLEDATSEDAVRAVASGSAELAVFGEGTPTGGLQTIVADSDDLVLLVPAAHPLAAERALPFPKALDYDFVAFGAATSLTRQISTEAEKVGRPLRIRVQVRGFDAMCRMVSAGLGLAVMPRAGAAPLARAMGLKLVRLTDGWTKRRLLLGMRDRESLSAPARGFVERVERRMAG